MARRVVVYEGGTYTSDTNNTANTIVERDGNKAIPGDVLSAAKQLIIGAVADFKGKAVSASENVDSSVTFYEVDATAADVELTLPPVGTVPGRVFILQKQDSSGHAARFKGNGGIENIDGANLKATTTQYGV